MAPRRRVDQAKYFGITVPQAIEVGRAAKEFTREKLSEPFTVFTRMSSAEFTAANPSCGGTAPVQSNQFPRQVDV